MRSDREPSLLKLQKILKEVRNRMGLKTQDRNPIVKDHQSNGAVEKTVDIIRQLSGSLLEQLRSKAQIEVRVDHPLFGWSQVHSAWLYNRFGSQGSQTPYEKATKCKYNGTLVAFGEPVMAWHRPMQKGSPRWKKAIFLTKVNSNDAYLVCSSQGVFLTRSVRRLGMPWEDEKELYKTIKAVPWNFQLGSAGTRVRPTPFRAPISAPTLPALEPLPMPALRNSELQDEAASDPTSDEEIDHQRAQVDSKEDEKVEEPPKPISMMEQPATVTPDDVRGGSGGTEAKVAAPMLVPTVPDNTTLFDLIRTPLFASSSGSSESRPLASTTRTMAEKRETTEESSKKARVEIESPKRARKDGPLGPRQDPHARQVESFPLETEELYYMDETEIPFDVYYEYVDDQVDTNMCEDDEALWFKEVPDYDEVQMQELDMKADTVEVNRLLSMGVLKQSDHALDQEGAPQFSTKFVRTWRSKRRGDEDWMLRRSRLVAREYRWLDNSREDTYSPATSTSILRLLPHLFLNYKAENFNSQMALCVADVKDAFLTVPQPTEVIVRFPNDCHVKGKYRLAKVLPGQRSGPQLWCNHFVSTLRKMKKIIVLTCNVCPAVLRLDDGEGNFAVIVMHVDDLMILSHQAWLKKKLLPFLEEHFEIHYEIMEKPGDQLSFLKREHVLRDDWTISISSDSRYVAKMIELAGILPTTKPKPTPTLTALMEPDLTEELGAEDSSKFRSIVGIGLYFAHDRADLLFAIRLLSSFLKKPTKLAWRGIRRFVEYVMGTDFSMTLSATRKGSNIEGNEEGTGVHTIVIYSDADWSGSKANRRSVTSAVFTLDGNTVHSICRLQKIVSLSSAESEWYAGVSACCEGLFLRRVLCFMVNAEEDQIVLILKMDNSAARALAIRRGVTSRLRHIDGRLLWLQQHVEDKQIQVLSVSSLYNLGDIGTKALGPGRLRALLYLLKYVDNGLCGERVGVADYMMMRNKSDIKTFEHIHRLLVDGEGDQERGETYVRKIDKTIEAPWKLALSKRLIQMILLTKAVAGHLSPFPKDMSLESVAMDFDFEPNGKHTETVMQLQYLQEEIDQMVFWIYLLAALVMMLVIVFSTMGYYYHGALVEARRRITVSLERGLGNQGAVRELAWSISAFNRHQRRVDAFLYTVRQALEDLGSTHDFDQPESDAGDDDDADDDDGGGDEQHGEEQRGEEQRGEEQREEELHLGDEPHHGQVLPHQHLPVEHRDGEANADAVAAAVELGQEAGEEQTPTEDPDYDFGPEDDAHAGAPGQIRFNAFVGNTTQMAETTGTLLTSAVARSRSRSRDREQPDMEPQVVDDLIAEAAAARDRAIAAWEERYQQAEEESDVSAMELAEDRIQHLTHIL